LIYFFLVSFKTLEVSTPFLFFTVFINIVFISNFRIYELWPNKKPLLNILKSKIRYEDIFKNGLNKKRRSKFFYLSSGTIKSISNFRATIPLSKIFFKLKNAAQNFSANFFVSGVFYKNVIFNVLLKGQCHEIFDLRFFSLNNTPCSPHSRAKAFLNSASNSPRYDRFSDASCNIWPLSNS
jgi:hypothetical protein